MFLGEGFGIGFRGVLLLWGKGVGRGGGGGGDRQRNWQVNAQALSKLPFSNLPFSFSPIISVFEVISETARRL